MKYISSDTNIWLDFETISRTDLPFLTGDNALRKAAIKEGVEVIGSIGILDKLYEDNHINTLEYKYCLEQLLEHKERRLPEEEMIKRLEAL